MILTSEALGLELKEAKLKQEFAPRDSVFYCPSIKWLAEFSKYFHDYCRPTYKREAYDCEDFCIRAVDRANDSLVASDSVNGCGHTLFIVIISIRFDSQLNGIPGSFETHATILCRLQEGWHYWEPQTSQLTALNQIPDDTVILHRVAL